MAHTKLAGSSPADEASLPKAPTQVVLTFSTDVSETLQQVEVVPPGGGNVAGAPQTTGSRVSVPVSSKAAGRYSVAWRVLGADGHPIRGTFTFTVREGARDSEAAPAEPGEEAPPAVDESDEDLHAAHRQLETYPTRALNAVAGVARALFYLTLLLVVGGAIFSSLIARGWRPRHFRRSCLVLLVSSITIFVTNLAIAGEYSVWGVINPWNFVPHAATPVGRVALGCAVMSLVMLYGYRRLRDAASTGDHRVRMQFAAAAVLLGAIPAFGGHAVASELTLLRVPADVLHLVAASIWFGGIVQLQAVSGASYAKHPAVYPAAQRFARLAFVSVVTLVVTGTIAALLEIGFDAGDLFGTTYGRLVLVKLALLAFTIPLAHANQQRHIPKLLEMTRRSPRNLRRYVAYEVVLVAMVIVVTSWLVYATPPKHLHHMQGHGAMNS